MTPINVRYYKSSSKILCRPVKSLIFLHRNFTTLFCSRNTARKPPTEPQLFHVTFYLTHGLSKRNIFFLTFFRASYLFLNHIFSESINHFPDLYIDSILLPLQQCLAKISGIIKSSHGNMYVTKQHICYTVELHCLYKNRSPDDAKVILMIPCFFFFS